ncbi:hypothetical protein PBY51_021059 [Eleginops maclovinus]|uniref:Sushi domain-containing protein n=1 Tax=Eleginops maclovinus TaxID=56733 RepID=A0AAN7XF34_ELEMC|nr:hypothetical protein PBY51_021059 [Eleginops maclovinus]
MCVRNLGFILLVWIPQVLNAQSAVQPCPAPRLSGGYFVPEQESYPHETTLTYACDNGHKPAVEGWWATSYCENGNWFPTPQCIDENACVPLTIPNANYVASTNGWYEKDDKIWVTCDEGYEHKDHDATAKCINGTWSSVPICEKSAEACGEPLKIPHAVIIHQGYQELFEADSQVQYECEDGYTAERADTKTVICISGNWTEGPTCNRRTTPSTGHGGSAGSSRISKPDKEIVRQVTTVNNCGTPPAIVNGDFVTNNGRFLEYQCAAYYKRVGLKTVRCYSDGTWTKAPTCKPTFCVVRTAAFSHLKPAGTKYIYDRETEKLECSRAGTFFNHYSETRCTSGKITFSECCNSAKIGMHLCNDLLPMGM